MSEPDFISQCRAGLVDDAARQKWFRGRFADAKANGATWARYTIHPKHGWVLAEFWRVRPKDEGEPRWGTVVRQTFIEKWVHRIAGAWDVLTGRAWAGYGNPLDGA